MYCTYILLSNTLRVGFGVCLNKNLCLAGTHEHYQGQIDQLAISEPVPYCWRRVAYYIFTACVDYLDCLDEIPYPMYMEIVINFKDIFFLVILTNYFRFYLKYASFLLSLCNICSTRATISVIIVIKNFQTIFSYNVPSKNNARLYLL